MHAPKTKFYGHLINSLRDSEYGKTNRHYTFISCILRHHLEMQILTNYLMFTHLFQFDEYNKCVQKGISICELIQHI